MPHESSLLYSMLHPSTYDDAVCVNADMFIVLDYNVAVCQGMATVLNLLKAGNQALASIGFIMQCAPHRLLPAPMTQCGATACPHSSR